MDEVGLSSRGAKRKHVKNIFCGEHLVIDVDLRTSCQQNTCEGVSKNDGALMECPQLGPDIQRQDYLGTA